MEIRKKNYAWTNPDLPSNGVITNCNLSQKLYSTKVGNGTQKFIDCNLLNCDVSGSECEKSLIVQKDLCYWLHNELDLPVEPENCRHVYETDTVWIDGVLVETTYYREDIIL